MEKQKGMRQCVGCRQSFLQKTLIRVVRAPEGDIAMDLTGKMHGRGAYLCKRRSCLDKAVRSKGLERALKTAVPPAIHAQLAEGLPNDE
ncbi:MAG: YlxR family protein [Eubacteriales bacterium]|nr:YlxR family protein [Eubacteriales bacterium]